MAFFTLCLALLCCVALGEVGDYLPVTEIGDTTIAASDYTYRVLVFNDPGRVATGTSVISQWSNAMVDAAYVAAYNINRRGGIDGHKIEIVERPVKNGSYKGTLQAYLAEVGAGAPNPNATGTDYGRFIAVYGVARGEAPEELRPLMEEHSLLSFGHNMDTSHLPENTINVFTHTNSYIQLLGLLRQLVIVRHLRRIGLMCVTDRDDPDGSQRSAELAGILKGFGLSITGIYATSFNLERTVSETEHRQKWEQFSANDPQAVVLTGSPVPFVERFTRDCLIQLTRGRTVVIASLHELISPVKIAVEGIFTNNGDPENTAARERIKQNAVVLYSLSNPSADMPYGVVRLFRAQYEGACKALKAAGSPHTPRMHYKHFKERTHSTDVHASHVLGGWLAFQVLIEAMKTATGSKEPGQMFNRIELRESLFGQRIFIPGGGRRGRLDLAFGIYSSNCRHLAGATGLTKPQGSAECICNQGGHDAFIVGLDLRGQRVMQPVDFIRTSINDCKPLELSMEPTIMMYRPTVDAMRMGLDSQWEVSLAEFLRLQEAGQRTVPFVSFTGVNSYEGQQIERLTSQSHREAVAAHENGFASLIGGGLLRIPIHPSMAMAVIETIPQITMPFSFFKFSRNVVRVNAIPELELMALAGFIEWKVTGRNMRDLERGAATYDDVIKADVYLCINDNYDNNAPIYGDNRRRLLERYARAILGSHMIELRGVIYMPPEDQDIGRALDRGYADNSYMIVIGFDGDNMKDLIKMKGRYPKLRFLFPFTNLIRFYDSLAAAPEQYTANDLSGIYFSTSLPPWLPQGHDAGRTMQQFYTLTEGHAHLRTPYILTHYILEQFLTTISHLIISDSRGTAQQITGEKLLEYIYSQRYITLDETLSFGPFYDTLCGNPEKIEANDTRDSMWADPERAFSVFVREDPCERNWANSRVYVRSLASAMGRGGPGADANEYQYLPDSFVLYEGLPPKPRSVLPLVLGVVLGLLLLGVLAFLLYWFCFRTKPRDVTFAPKDISKPVTIIFTDIQSSTSLWAEIPDTMGPALDAHHALIRKLVRQHRGYEVKTIGDAFMVAFSSATDAVTFAYDLQFEFFNFDWESAAGSDIEETYHVLEHALIENIFEEGPPEGALAILPFGGASHMVLLGDETVAPTLQYGDTTSPVTRTESSSAHGDNHTSSFAAALTADTHHGHADEPHEPLLDVRTRYLTCNLSPQQYAEAWHGLRVRIGVNTGFAEIKLDAITQGYDYYGSVTNVASRTEACAWGGQVIITGATLSALRLEAEAEGRPMTFQTASYGPQLLRGVPEPLELHHVYTVPGRMFGPLRLDHVYAKEDTNSSESTSHHTAQSHNSGHIYRDEDLFAGLAYVLFATLFSTTAKRKRAGDLEALCKSWRLKPSERRALKLMRHNQYIQWRALSRRGLPAAPGTIQPGLFVAAEHGLAAAAAGGVAGGFSRPRSRTESASSSPVSVGLDSHATPMVNTLFTDAANDGHSGRAMSFVRTPVQNPNANFSYVTNIDDTFSLDSCNASGNGPHTVVVANILSGGAPDPHSGNEEPSSTNKRAISDVIKIYEPIEGLATAGGHQGVRAVSRRQSAKSLNHAGGDAPLASADAAPSQLSLQKTDLAPNDSELVMLASRISAVALRQLPRTVRDGIHLLRLALVGAEAAHGRVRLRNKRSRRGSHAHTHNSSISNAPATTSLSGKIPDEDASPL